MSIDITPYLGMVYFEPSDGEHGALQKKIDWLLNSFSSLDTFGFVESEGFLIADSDQSLPLPLVTVLPLTNSLRDDKIDQPFSRNEVLLNAPEQDSGYFVVPKLLS